MMKNLFCIGLLLCGIWKYTCAQEVIELYSGAIPNSKEVKDDTNPPDDSDHLIRRVIKPTLEIYLPEKEKATGAAVVICPGGGYSVIVYEGEGVKTAKELAKNGVAAFVLKYRLPNDTYVKNKTIGPLQDALQAIKRVREDADKYGIDVNKVGIMGFSAGGHLASTVATHYDENVIVNEENTNLRPDFQILIYPVISMQDSLTHPDSRRKLLGDNPSKELIDKYSNELQIDQHTPPAYITQAGDDKVVSVGNSISYYQNLIKNDVPAEMHLYPKGNHGFVLFQPINIWVRPILNWMQNSGWTNE